MLNKTAAGRFAQINKSNVVGSTPVPLYPAGPAWSLDPVPTEEPLGYDINEHEPVGTAQEIEASLGGALAGHPSCCAPALGESAATGPQQLGTAQSQRAGSPSTFGEVRLSDTDKLPPVGAVEPPSPIQRLKRRLVRWSSEA